MFPAVTLVWGGIALIGAAWIVFISATGESANPALSGTAGEGRMRNVSKGVVKFESF